MIRTFAVAGLLATMLANCSHAGFELQAALSGQNPSGTTSFTSGGALATTIQLDLFLVENTGASFSTTGAIFDLSRTSGPATVGSNLDNGFGLGSGSGSDPVFTFSNSFGTANSTSAGGLAFVKVGQIDILPDQTALSSVFSFVPNNPTAEQFTIDGNVQTIAQQNAIFGSSASFVTAVPEPSSALLLGVVGIGAVLRRRRTS